MWKGIEGYLSSHRNGLLLVSSLLNGFYYLPIVIAGFFKKRTVDVEKQTIPMGAQISLILLLEPRFSSACSQMSPLII